MTSTFKKPFIPFDAFTSLYANVWLKANYNNCKTEEEVIEFAFDCLKESERTTNEVRKKDCFSLFNYLYQLATGESYQSKIPV